MGTSEQYRNLWQQAFEGAELQPSGAVWDRIDATLSRDEAGNYKKRLFYISLVAAASFVFAIAAGILGLLGEFHNQPEKNIVITQKEDDTILEDQTNESEKLNQKETITEEYYPANPESISKNLIQDVDEDPGTYSNLDDPRLTQINNVQRTLVEVETLDKIPFRWTSDLPQSDPHIQYYPPWSPIKKKQEVHSFWAGINMGAGSTDFNYDNNDLIQASKQAIGSGVSELEASVEPAISYIAGVSFGKRVKARWQIQSGLQYAFHRSDGSTNQQITRGNESTPLLFGDIITDGSVGSIATDIGVTNTFEFLSVPFQVGYMIVDNKFGWSVNTGLSSNFFLKNTVTDDQEIFDKQTIRNSGDSPFRSVYFDGIVSTELMYRVADQYSISLVPRYSIALNSLTKTSSLQKSTPSGISLGLRFRYLFR